MRRNNIYLAYILTFLGECYWPSVAALFFYLRYFTFAQIATLWAIQLATANLLEIPTGAFADLVGRRTSIIISFVLSAVSLFIFPFMTSFWIFVILEVVKGLANALYSGSMEALVYDSLKQEGTQKTYPMISANFETINWTAWAISAIGGGYLYYWHYQSPWLIQGIMFVIATILGFKLIEPKIDSIKMRVSEILSQPIQGFRELFQTKRIGGITLQLAVIGAGYIIASNILGASQAREYGFDARGTGWLFGIGCLFSVVASRNFVKMKNWLGEKKLIILTTMMLLISFLVAKHVGIVAGSTLIIMRIASSSTFRNTRSVIVNGWISSRNRATALSTLNLLTQTPYILLSPIFGMMIDKTSPNQFAWFLGLGIMIVIVITRVVSWQNWRGVIIKS
jgi:MFS family permease